MKELMRSMGQKAKAAARILSSATREQKDAALKIISFDFFDIHQSLLCEYF